MIDDPYNLIRFIEAQAPVYDAVLAELSSGRKQTHWMWFVFPQLAGLGHSPMAQRYAIVSAEEAQAYLDHPASARACTSVPSWSSTSKAVPSTRSSDRPTISSFVPR